MRLPRFAENNCQYTILKFSRYVWNFKVSFPRHIWITLCAFCEVTYIISDNFEVTKIDIVRTVPNKLKLSDLIN